MTLTQKLSTALTQLNISHTIRVNPHPEIMDNDIQLGDGLNFQISNDPREPYILLAKNVHKNGKLDHIAYLGEFEGENLINDAIELLKDTMKS